MPFRKLDPQALEKRTSLFLQLSKVVFNNFEVWASEKLHSPSTPGYIQRVVFTEDSYYSVPYEMRPREQLVLGNHIDEILSYEATAAYIEQCKSDQLFEDVQENGAKRTASLPGAIISPLSFIISRCGTTHPTDKQIEDTYTWYDKALYFQYTECKFLILLKNIAVVALDESIRIGDAVLSTFSLEEKNHLSLRMPQLGMSDAGKLPSIISKASTKLSLSYEGYINDTETREKCRTQIKRAMTVLRLYYSGWIGSSLSLFVTDFGSIEQTNEFAVEDNQSPMQFATEQHAVALQELFEMLDEHTEYELAIPISRFNLAHTRRSGEDRIIDLAICLESLLSDSSDAIAYRMQLRGAALLRKSHKPAEVKEFIALVYDVRSKVVHTGKTLEDIERASRGEDSLKKIRNRMKGLSPSLKPQQFPLAYHELVRAILRQCVELVHTNKKMGEIREDLDNELLEGLLSLP